MSEVQVPISQNLSVLILPCRGKTSISTLHPDSTEQSIPHLRDLIEHILSMSMDGRENIAINKTLIELKRLFTQIAARKELKTEKRIDNEILVLPENLTVYADRTHLHNVVSNLMEITVKSVPNKGAEFITKIPVR